MGIFGKAKKEEELVLVFDIGSSSVKAAFFYMQKSGIPKIVFSIREPIQLEDKIDINNFLALTLKALDAVIDSAYQKRLGAPSRIFCILSSPWHISQTRVLRVKEAKPFTFTPKLAEELVRKEISALEEEYRQKYAHPGDTLRRIELKNIKVALNGYETKNPIGKKAKEVEMTIFVSMSAEEVCRKIEEAIAKHFSLGESKNGIKFSSFPLAAFTVVRDMHTDREDFLLVNIGGEITDINMIKNNALRESTSFPLGINFMVRAVASATRSDLREAKSFISLYKDGHADAKTARLLAPIVTRLKSEWLAKFQESLANLSKDISIPAFVYVTVDKDLADFFRETIKTEQFNQYTLTESKFQIIFLNADNLRDVTVFEKEAMFNAFLAIDAVYINRFFN